MEPCGMNTDYGDGKLPPGFRFHPTDEELVNYYLTTKVLNNSFSERAIAEVDLNKCEPWDLPEKAKMGEKEWYFFSLRDRKYPTGLRTNRATEAGYWKATGKDREVFNATTGDLIGMKKTLVFYKGRAPRGEKTNWVMHEYRLEGNFSYHQLPGNCKDEWVVCRIFHKSAKKSPSELVNTRNLYMDDCYWGSAGSLPPLLESPTATTNNLHSEEAEDISAAAGLHLINSNHQHHHRQASNIVGTNNNNPHFMNAHHNLAGISWQPNSGANPVLKALLEQTYNNASNNHNSNHLCMKNSSHSGNRMEENGLISPHWSSNVSNQAAAATHHGSLNLYGQAHASHCLDIQQPQMDPSLVFGVVDPSSTSTASPSFLSQLQLNDDVGYL